MKKESSVSKDKKDTKKKVQTKDAKVIAKKVDAKKTKPAKKNIKKEKQNIAKKAVGFFSDVRKEMKKVHFPSKKEMIKYSVATICFVIFFSLFFYIIDVIFALIKSLA